jgi:hypothetical protein
MPELTNAAQVRATLYYQSIPPSYLRQRAEDANGPDTARLIKYTNELDVNKYTEISNWKLKVTSSGPIDISVSGAGTVRKSERSLLGKSTTPRGRRHG